MDNTEHDQSQNEHVNQHSADFHDCSIPLNKHVKPLVFHENPITTGYLEICMGPMFAGKTTHLLDLIDNFNHTSTPFTVLKPTIDNRYNVDKITSHDNVSYKCVAIDSLDDTIHMKLTDNILIEEGQFLENLYEYVVKWINEGKYVYIACLNGDYKMEPMGDIYKLIPMANKIIHKTARCKCGR